MSGFTTRDLCRVLGIEFSQEQLAAITAPLEPAVIMAGAGSGKTSVMTARVVWLVATEGVAPEQVLGLTFTNKAAGELRTRVRSALSQLELPAESADAATIATYHSFAQQLLLDEGMRIGLEPDLQLLSDVRRQQLATRVVREPGIDIEWLSHSTRSIVRRVLALEDRLAEEAVDIEEVRRFDRELVARMEGRQQQATGRDIIETARERLEAVALVERFRQLKLEAQCIDYADMVRLALRLVRERPEVATRLRQQHRVVLLDEYQDTSVAQRLLMQCAFGEGHPVTAVGDALQAIYEWRGANAINIIDFPEHFPVRAADGATRAASVYGLPKTQRFGSHLAQAANAITHDLRAGMRHVQELEAQSDERFGPGRIEVALHGDQDAEFTWIAQRLREAGADTAWRDMAVLLRQHRHAGAVYEALTAAGVPAQIVGKQALLTVPDIADLVAYLRVLDDPAANPAWVRILAGPRYRLGVRDLAHLGRRAGALAAAERADGWEAALAAAAAGSDSVDLVALGDAIADPGEGSGLSDAALARLAELQREVHSLRRLVGHPVGELVRAIAQRIGLDVEVEASSRAVARGRRAAVEAFVELCAEFSSLEGSQSLSAFLRWLDDGERLGAQAEIEYPVDRNAVSIMTVHSAKGLQRDVIVLPALAEGTFPTDRSDAAWPTSAEALPFALLHSTVDEQLLAYPGDEPRSVEAKAFQSLLKPRKLAEETRLAYVAVTRAQRLLIATAARSYGGRAAEPSRYLMQLREAAARLDGMEHCWAEPQEPDAAAEPARAAWPVDLEASHQARLLAAARAVDDPAWQPQASARLSVEEAAQVARWDAAIEHHRAERLAALAVTHAVPLPAMLTASEVQALAKDADAFLLELVRPMPRRPAPAAARGSAFHAWLEQQFGQQLLIGDLDGREDDDAELQALQRAFEASEWARRTPLAIEVPFTIALGAVVVRGRIDAVYRDGEDIIVVDWKTNARSSSDPTQLAIYRQAAAAKYGVPLERVRSCFVYVAQGRTEWHSADLDPVLLLDSLRQGLAEPILDGAPGDGDR